ncbi:phospholipase/carboxylesterase [Xanthobacter sp. SG618]|uniref:alpha/beta hydrolase n=1 Tax=Xanthobacter sp. SG618 TaxID=2587121 RepID=UPI00145CA0D5|nr:dienelactone hydrolase family protein [Xanthobacter sp. SG618]NMN57022.1 phospholipase/carboxylesterase [Xanthobacter sp. SG618]
MTACATASAEAPRITAGPKIAALSCGKPVYLVVLLHAEGSCGQEVIDLALNWAPELPKADFLAAEAPFPGSAGARWFPGEGFSPDTITAGLTASAPLLDAFLDEMLAARRLPGDHLALVGFSQGAMLALDVGLRRAVPPAVIIAFGGALPEARDVSAPRTQPPVVFIHGEDDAVVPLADMVATRDRLKALGLPAKSMRRPGLGHGVDDDGIIAAGSVLSASLVKPKPKTAGEHDDHHHDDHDHDH